MKINAFEGQKENLAIPSMTQIVLQEMWGADDDAAAAADKANEQAVIKANEPFNASRDKALAELKAQAQDLIKAFREAKFFRIRSEVADWAFPPILTYERSNSYSKEMWVQRPALNPESVFIQINFEDGDHDYTWMLNCAFNEFKNNRNRAFTPTTLAAVTKAELQKFLNQIQEWEKEMESLPTSDELRKQGRYSYREQSKESRAYDIKRYKQLVENLQQFLEFVNILAKVKLPMHIYRTSSSYGSVTVAFREEDLVSRPEYSTDAWVTKLPKDYGYQKYVEKGEEEK